MTDKTFTPELPRELRAEELTLACALTYGPDAMPPDVRCRLSPAQFTDGLHRVIFDTWTDRHANGQPCAAEDVADALRKAGHVPASVRTSARPGTSPPASARWNWQPC